MAEVSKRFDFENYPGAAEYMNRAQQHASCVTP
jgi:hypothetical protein